MRICRVNGTSNSFQRADKEKRNREQLEDRIRKEATAGAATEDETPHHGDSAKVKCEAKFGRQTSERNRFQDAGKIRKSVAVAAHEPRTIDAPGCSVHKTTHSKVRSGADDPPRTI